MDGRTEEELRQHYQVEVELAATLRKARKEERRALYSSVYDELFQRVPSHPQLRRKATVEDSARRVRAQMKCLDPFLRPDAVFMEVGPGDCKLAAAVAGRVQKVYAVDVSCQITERDQLPPNVELVLSDGVSVPVVPETIHIAYSNQLLEHLHPEDALEQLGNIHAALVPGGVYLCITPNRLSGPHDISRYFASVAEGLHSKEYTNYEVLRLFGKAGFSRVDLYPRGRALDNKFRLVACEGLLGLIPTGMRRRLLSAFHLSSLFSSVVAVGAK
jgi:SAM-dependent methyltransferase